MDTAIALCARCGKTTPRDVIAAGVACTSCGEDPRLDGRYWLDEQLGHGAFGTTYRATRELDGQPVAVKELLVRRLADFKAHDLFKREAQVLRSLEHPGIPRYIDDFVAGEGRHLGLYLVVELVSGRTLADELVVRRHDLRSALATARELCDILAYLHERTPPVIHRDLKPANVMRQDDGRLVLIDFGSVKDVVRQGEGSTVAGTFGYMAPEQLAGRATPASDLYALGALLLELVTRQPPHELLDDQNRLVWQPFVDEGPLRDLLSDLLEPDPSRRLRDAREVARRIDDLLAGRATAAAKAPLRTGGGSFIGKRAPVQDLPGGMAQQLQQAMGLLQGLGIPHIGAPGRADPPPDAPRKTTFGFGKKVDPVGHFFRFFGILFGGPATIGIASVFGSVSEVGGPGLAFLPFLLFPILGLTFFLIGQRRVSRAAKVYREGEVAPAVITDVSVNTSLRVNGRSPHRVTFRFEDASGVAREGTASRFGIRPDLRVPGAEVFAIYDPAKPEKALLWPL